jgi:excisionase family DNA binding protein
MSAIVTALLAELDDDALRTLAERLKPYLPADQATTTWLDVTAAAAHLNCPKSRLYALVSAHRIPHCKDGSRLLFDRHDLDTWIRDGGGRRP